jgi:hypothetical protein
MTAFPPARLIGKWLLPPPSVGPHSDNPVSQDLSEKELYPNDLITPIGCSVV